MQVKIKKLHPDAITPTYATDGSGCFDLYALSDWVPSIGNCYYGDNLPVEFFEGNTFSTGISIEIPSGYIMIAGSRSGHGFKKDTRLANCLGFIDSDYRGECLVRLFNDGREPFIVRKGDRIAQAMIIPVPRVEFVEVDELSETGRGNGGFGSTGK